MNAISVSYRFSRQELSALLQALRLNGLPGAPLEPLSPDQAREALADVAGKELGLVAGDTLYVDRVTDLILRSAAQPLDAVAFTDDSRTGVLWRAERLWLLGDFPAQGDCSLTPLEHEEAVRDALGDALCRFVRPLWAANVFDSARRMTLEEQAPGDPVEQILALARPGDVPGTGKSEA